MNLESFDTNLHRLMTGMVEIAFEYVGRNSAEVDDIYIFCCFEGGLFYNVFYRINSNFCKMHIVNSVSKMQYDTSTGMKRKLLSLGNQDLLAVQNLFVDAKKEVPTRIMMNYQPKNKAFKSQIEYNKLISEDNEKMAADLFEEWYTKIISKTE